MNNNKKIIATRVVVSIAMMILATSSVYASEITGTLSSTGSSSSQPTGTISGSVQPGGTISGSVQGGSGGTGGASGAFNAVGGNNASNANNVSGGAPSGTSSGNPLLSGTTSPSLIGGPLALEDPAFTSTPGLPNAGSIPPDKPNTLWSLVVLCLGFLTAAVVSKVVRNKEAS